MSEGRERVSGWSGVRLGVNVGGGIGSYCQPAGAVSQTTTDDDDDETRETMTKGRASSTR